MFHINVYRREREVEGGRQRGGVEREGETKDEQTNIELVYVFSVRTSRKKRVLEHKLIDMYRKFSVQKPILSVKMYVSSRDIHELFLEHVLSILLSTWWERKWGGGETKRDIT